MDVETLDLRESAGVGAVSGDELGDDGERLASVDSEALAVEASVTLAVRVEIASVRITEASVAALAGSSTTLGTSALGLSSGTCARMGRVRRRDLMWRQTLAKYLTRCIGL